MLRGAYKGMRKEDPYKQQMLDLSLQEMELELEELKLLIEA